MGLYVASLFLVFSGSTLRYESVQMCYKVLGFLILIANYINQ